MWAEVPGKALQRKEAVGAGREDGPTWDLVWAEGSQTRGLGCTGSEMGSYSSTEAHKGPLRLSGHDTIGLPPVQ